MGIAEVMFCVWKMNYANPGILELRELWQLSGTAGLKPAVVGGHLHKL
jgi:hypothetical protein